LLNRPYHSQVQVNIYIKENKEQDKRQPSLQAEWGKLQNEDVLQEFQKHIDKAMDYKYDDGAILDESWGRLKLSALNTAVKVLGRAKKHQDWFDENDAKLNAVLDERNKAKSKVLQRRTRSSTERLMQVQIKLQMCIRVKKFQWWEQKAKALQQAADRNNMKAFYNCLKEVYGLQNKRTA